MEIKEITDKAVWEAFLKDQKPNTFLQSWNWKEVQEADGERVSTLGFYNGEELIAVALAILVHAKRGAHYLIPHGPILKDKKDLPEVIHQLFRFYKLENKLPSVALRIAPLIENTLENQKLFQKAGFIPAPMHVHAELTWMLDIQKSEEEILSGMRKTTRHAIKKAQTEGVRVEIISDSSAINRFWPLYDATKDRHGFVPFSKAFIKSQADIFGKDNAMFFAIATHEGKDVAGALCLQFGDTVFYYHGASLKLPSNIPAAQLLQWEAIREAKKLGASRYNFWGVAPEGAKNHPFAGITIFKKGFGGYAVDYLHAQDLPLSWKYWILWGIEMYRKKRRGF